MKAKESEKTQRDEPLKKLGNDLRQMRKAQNLTLMELAEASGRSVSFLSKIERGLARPSVTALQEIAAALRIPVGWFFETDGPVPARERPFIVRANRRRKLTYSGVSGTEYMGFEDHLLSASLGQTVGDGYFKLCAGRQHRR